MTRRVEHADLHVAERQVFAVLGDVDVVFRLGGRAVHDLRAGQASQVDVTAHEIGVEMGLQYILDLRPAFFGQLQVRFGLPQRINDRRFTVRFNVIRRLSEAGGVKLLNVHDCWF